MNTNKEFRERVLNASGKDELKEAYSEWAEHYDSELSNTMDYVAPVYTGKLLQKYLGHKMATILDAGCGTGLVGEYLHPVDNYKIEGLDYSPDMLEKAREKKVYKKLFQGDLTSQLNLVDDYYDAVISVGTFTCAHVGPEAFDEFLRITRPGGYICFSVREEAWVQDNYQRRIAEIKNSGLWIQLEINSTDYIKSEGSRCKICIFKVNT